MTSRKTWGNLHSSGSRWLCAPADTLAGPLSVWGRPRRMWATRVASTPPIPPPAVPGGRITPVGTAGPDTVLLCTSVSLLTDGAMLLMWGLG